MTNTRNQLRDSENQRKPTAHVQDRVLLLALFSRLNHHGFIGDPMKVQKTVFLTEYLAARANALVFSYPYFRWNFGPFSKELKDDYSLLSDKLGYVDESDQFELSPKGAALADAFWLDVLRHPRNDRLREALEGAARSCAGKSGWVLKKEVYELEVRSAPSRRSNAGSEILTTVEKTPKSYEFLVAPDDPEYRLFMAEGWEETLAIELQEHSQARDSLRRAQSDVAAGRVREGDAVPTGAED